MWAVDCQKILRWAIQHTRFLFFKTLCAEMGQHASKLSENFTFSFYSHNILFFLCITSVVSHSRGWSVRIFYSLSTWWQAHTRLNLPAHRRSFPSKNTCIPLINLPYSGVHPFILAVHCFLDILGIYLAIPVLSVY